VNNLGIVEDNGQFSVIDFNSMRTHTFTEEHVNFTELLEAFKNDDIEELLELLDVSTPLASSLAESTGEVTIKDGSVYFDGVPVRNEITDKVLKFFELGLDYKPLVNFLKRLRKNPSKRSVDQLFNFLQHENLAIAEDGRFLAYKSVRSDYKDKYSGKLDNSVGSVVQVTRNTVDDNPEAHCSHGLHVGALEYAGPGGWYNRSGDRVVIVAVDPADAVSVPTDHSSQKLRVCKYEVVKEFERPLGVTENISRQISGAIDPEDLEGGDTVLISSYGDDYVGIVNWVDDENIEIETEDGEEEFYIPNIDNLILIKRNS
jgi:hypothetical protein